ncbi:MAG: cysteine desulfurase [Gammaproteobacteria bacterium]|nr:cysteine desulfurase [Gammaproteobacteria bacterium]MYF31551.1 cysteine desulfurase [Gammaproteobacteria bacterium]MYK47068.1 cysteine desulfurase [Gammaproteobacteria bacterium]
MKDSSWRGDFPLLRNRADLVYLDNAATTQKPTVVLDALARYYGCTNANVHRGAHRLSDEATAAFEAARETLARRINARSSREVLWTRGTTEAINLVAGSYGPLAVGDGDRILITEMEHHSNIVPWQQLCQRTGAVLRAVRVLPSGELDRDDFDARLEEQPRIVSISHVSNALGTVNDLPTLIGRAKSAGAVVVVDGAQAVAHFDIDVAALDCDFYAFSGHKMYGPTGIGVLYGREELLDAMPPWQCGGEMIERVRIEETTFAPLPFKFEAGTPDISGAIALAAAVDYLDRQDGNAVATHEAGLLAYATSSLNQVEGLRIVGTASAKGPVVSFLFEDAHPHDVGTLLDQQGVAVRTGHHCAMPLMDALGIPGTVRASFSLYNCLEDVDKLCQAVRTAKSML